MSNSGQSIVIPGVGEIQHPPVEMQLLALARENLVVSSNWIVEQKLVWRPVKNLIEGIAASVANLYKGHLMTLLKSYVNWRHGKEWFIRDYFLAEVSHTEYLHGYMLILSLGVQPPLDGEQFITVELTFSSLPKQLSDYDVDNRTGKLIPKLVLGNIYRVVIPVRRFLLWMEQHLLHRYSECIDKLLEAEDVENAAHVSDHLFELSYEANRFVFEVLYSLLLNNPYAVGKAFEKLQTFWNGTMSQLSQAERDDEMWLDDVQDVVSDESRDSQEQPKITDST
jgi:hypothetical protein